MKQFIIYGAGKRGIGLYDLFTENNLEQYIYGFCDKDYEIIKEIGTKKVMSYEEACKTNLPFLISFIDKEQKLAIKEQLLKDGKNVIDENEFAGLFGYNDLTEYNRMLCKFFHKKSMDAYFESSENTLDVFWGENSEFYPQFAKLDTSRIIELACGRGRHVAKYVSRADSVTHVDILEENIEFCRKRFQGDKKISYYNNNGKDLSQLPDGKYTAVFSYDSMVHFEMLDIYSYLKEFYRVLAPGGQALLHHSNNTSDYKASFANAPHGRAFMSRELFAHMAYKSGFEIVCQKVIDWGIENLDCISLIRKPCR